MLDHIPHLFSISREINTTSTTTGLCKKALIQSWLLHSLVGIMFLNSRHRLFAKKHQILKAANNWKCARWVWALPTRPVLFTPPSGNIGPQLRCKLATVPFGMWPAQYCTNSARWGRSRVSRMSPVIYLPIMMTQTPMEYETAGGQLGTPSIIAVSLQPFLSAFVPGPEMIVNHQSHLHSIQTNLFLHPGIHHSISALHAFGPTLYASVPTLCNNYLDLFPFALWNTLLHERLDFLGLLAFRHISCWVYCLSRLHGLFKSSNGS